MARSWSIRRFDLVELCLVAAVCGLAGWGFAHTRVKLHPEADVLEATYGSEHWSENEEEWIIRDFFGARRNGFFVDVGAGHYREFSNTYYLEHQLGWSGIAIEPVRVFEADYVKHRPRTRFFPFFVSNVSNEIAKMYTFGTGFLGNSSDKQFVERFGKNPTEVSVPTITLNDLFAREKVQAIDFITMDIELSEPKALAGFDIGRYKPALVCIEAHPEVRQQILDFFARHHYVVVGEYLRADDKNLYFTPLR